MKRKLLLLTVLGLLALGVAFRSTVAAHGRSLLLISEVFPQMPAKPLQLISPSPTLQQITLPSPHGSVVADLFLPSPSFRPIAPASTPAVILSMGVRTQDKDRPVLLNLGQTLSRLGIVAIWPRREALDRGMPLPEEPSTFLVAFHYLESVEIVDPTRISFIGFSVGSSTAFVTATDPLIANKTRTLVFFGGYYDIFEYLMALVTQTTSCSGQTISWRGDQGASEHIREILREKGSTELGRIFDVKTRQQAEEILRTAPRGEVDELRKLNPRDHLHRFETRIFILHDQGDPFVPYCESVKLNEALVSRVDQTFLIVNVFEHVQPKGGLAPETAADLARLYLFLAAAFESL